MDVSLTLLVVYNLLCTEQIIIYNRKLVNRTKNDISVCRQEKHYFLLVLPVEMFEALCLKKFYDLCVFLFILCCCQSFSFPTVSWFNHEMNENYI